MDIYFVHKTKRLSSYTQKENSIMDEEKELRLGNLLPYISHERKSDDIQFLGHVFDIYRRTMLIGDGYDSRLVNREVVTHLPVVYILAHRTSDDKYLIEREYRAGIDDTVYGIPAGMLDDGEDPTHAAVRELREETGVEVNADKLELIGGWDSSQGFTDEYAYVYRIDITPDDYKTTDTDFDEDETLYSTWISFDDLMDMVKLGLISGATAVAAIYHEALDRLSEVNSRSKTGSTRGI